MRRTFNLLGNIMEQTKTVAQPYPCYAAYSAVLRTLLGFKEDNFNPRTIDLSVFKGSGTTKSELKKGFEFLGLIEADGTVTPRFREMRDAVGTNQWASTLENVVRDAYKSVLSDLDIEHGTSQQLERAFQNTGISGSTKRKAIRFFLDAAKAAGIPLSPQFKTPPAPPRSRSSRQAQGSSTDKAAKTEEMGRNKNGVSEMEKPLGSTLIPEGYRKIEVPAPGFEEPCSFVFPDEITPEDWQLVIGFLNSWYDRYQKKKMEMPA